MVKSMPSLEVKNVDVFHGEIQALWDVSFSVDGGSLVALIGPNGAGKTTILKTILGVVKRTKGEIRFGSTRLDGLPPHRIVDAGIVYVPEGRRLFPDLSLLENLEMGSYPNHSRRTRDKNLINIFELFPVLKERAKQRAGTLSGGEAQMLAIGRALMAEPKLLMLDEPSSGLAPLLVNKIFDAIQKIQRAGVTLLLVEQDIHKSLSMCSKAYLLENGRVVRSGSGEELLSDAYIREAYLGI